MHESLPFRSRCRNFGTATAAPAALSLIATRANGADAAVVALRADLSDLPRAGAIRHAVQVLDAMAARFPGESVDVQLLDGAGIPMLLATADPEGRAAAGAAGGKPAFPMRGVGDAFARVQCARCGWRLRPDHGGICPVCSPTGDRR